MYRKKTLLLSSIATLSNILFPLSCCKFYHSAYIPIPNTCKATNVAS